MPRDGKYTPEEMKHQNRFAKEIADAGMTMKATLNELSQIRYNEGDINHQELKFPTFHSTLAYKQ